MVNDKVTRDLQGNIIKYICQCGAQYFPSPIYGFDGCPWEKIHGKGTCPDRNHGLSKPRKRTRYRKVKVGQANLRGLDVNGSFWGKEIRLTEDFLEVI